MMIDLKPSITVRELQILGFIVQGQTDREIAAALGITVHTINACRKNLLKKLGARNVASLVRIAIQQKLVPLYE
jgi:DNA-binding CsgD family transcriptional regulator